MSRSEFQLIGTIVGAHGLHGEVKVLPLTSWPERFLDLERCFIEEPPLEPEIGLLGAPPATAAPTAGAGRRRKGGPATAPKAPKVPQAPSRAPAAPRVSSAGPAVEDDGHVLAPWEVEGARLQGRRFVLLKLEGVEDRNGAEGFKGRTVHVPMAERMPLEEDEVYLDDLIGSQVQDLSGAVLGEVTDFLDYGGCGLVEFRLASGRRTVQVPFVDVYIAAVDADARIVTLTPSWRLLLEAEE